MIRAIHRALKDPGHLWKGVSPVSCTIPRNQLTRLSGGDGHMGDNPGALDKNKKKQQTRYRPQSYKLTIVHLLLYVGDDLNRRSAAMFITRDYRSRQPGCVTEMLRKLELPPLQDRRRAQRLTLLYKVVEGHVPTISIERYIKPLRPKLVDIKDIKTKYHALVIVMTR
ncbi:hypothetical protein DPMN_161736 [Dreissena polymorpha]|uniref:Uncharacterized protein n=1 Tax=Dreissena polymorpha TaxID=45954 RepID=A0A9D4IPX4_DREPO|nr:hypothetical protein DPMN_161736 [Dreissena polymorpha]